MANDPIYDLLQNLLEEAIELNASDIHLEPREEHLLVRYRIDGQLHIQKSLAKTLQTPLFGKLKILGHLAADENRLPQDGKWQFLRENPPNYDIRISLIPSLHGEDGVLRLLAASQPSDDLESLGFDDEMLRQEWKQILENGSGLFLVTGPTGSGKSTTLYTLLRQLNDGRRKLLTLEDPVEYSLEGVNQIQVNSRQGLSFADGLRALLRQAPNVILLGEIRDGETAAIAIQAALSGHLILSTVHGNDALGAISRLQNLSISPLLLSSVLRGILAQRLIRRLCPHCRKIHSPDLPIRRRFSLAETDLLAIPHGCDRCKNSGFSGRTLLYEWLPISEKTISLLRQLPSSEASMGAELRPASENCLRRKILAKTISLEEALAQLL